jgi:hypothetical protein
MSTSEPDLSRPTTISSYQPGSMHPDQWLTRRMPDAVRAAALANAVDFCRDRDVGESAPLYASPLVDDVLLIAARFEAYLTGEEAHDPTNP